MIWLLCLKNHSGSSWGERVGEDEQIRSGEAKKEAHAEMGISFYLSADEHMFDGFQRFLWLGIWLPVTSKVEDRMNGGSGASAFRNWEVGGGQGWNGSTRGVQFGEKLGSSFWDVCLWDTQVEMVNRHCSCRWGAQRRGLALRPSLMSEHGIVLVATFSVGH